MTRTIVARRHALPPAPSGLLQGGSASADRLRVAAAMTAALLLGVAPASAAQVPTPIPSDVQNQVLNLIQRVTALEAKLAAMPNANAPMRVRAPFVVVDAAGRPILQVVEASGKASASPGIVISAAPGSGHASLSLLNKSGYPVVEIANLPEEEGIALYDEAGRMRAGFGLDGVIETWDESKNAVLFVGPDAGKSEAALRLGKDEDGFALQVGSGADVARLGEDPGGIGALTLSDDQERTRASVTGEGTLQLWDASNKGLLAVSDNVTDSDAAVTIGRSANATRIKIQSGLSVAMGANSDVAAFAAFDGSKLMASLGMTGRGPRVILANDSQREAVELSVGNSGQGKLRLDNGDGTVAVEAGLSVDGVGVVNAYPQGLPGSFIKGQLKKK